MVNFLKKISVILLLCSCVFAAYQNTVLRDTLGGSSSISAGNYSMQNVLGKNTETINQNYGTTVYLNANNFYSMFFISSVDIIPPVIGSFSINNNNEYTDNLTVTLLTSASDLKGVSYMKISNDGINWSQTLAFNSTYTWQLTAGEGNKTVYIKVADPSYNWSNVSQASIIFDNGIPADPTGTLVLNVSGGAYSSGENTLTIDTSGVSYEAGTSLFWRYKNYGSSTWSEWGQLPSITGYLADGIILYEVELKVVDSAGNQSAGTITASQLSVDRIFNGTAIGNTSFPWSSDPNPGIITWQDPAGAAADSYDVYWGKDYSGAIANAGSNMSNSYDPSIITSGAGTYYLRVRTKDTAGNFGPWKTVAVYNYFLDESPYYAVSGESGVSANTLDVFESTENIALVRKESNLIIGTITINARELSINIKTETPKIVIDKDSNNLPYIMVPSEGEFASVVNAAKAASTPIWVPIKLGPFNSSPIITVSTGNGYVEITGYEGSSSSRTESDRIRNYIFDGTYVSFEVNEFSTYGTTFINNVVFENNFYYGEENESILVRARVIDYNNDGVENAPVTFSIENGDGTFTGSTAVTTNGEGWAVVTFNYPADFGTTTIKAATTGNISGTTYMVITGGLTPAQQAAYNEWAASFAPINIGGPSSDYDGEGLINLYEWNYGKAPISDPTMVDTDSDGINDKFDAAPTDNSSYVFNNSFAATPKTTAGELFSGTAANTNIVAQAGGMKLNYNTETRYASEDGIANDTTTVLKISGFAKERVYDGNLGETFENNLYQGLMPGKEYSVLFSYINRGNDSDSLTANITLDQESSRWTTLSNGLLNNISKWQKIDYEVKVLPANALAYERTTLKVTLSLLNGNAVEYSKFTEAYGGGTLGDEGIYGGDDYFNYEFYLQAESVDLVFVDRIAYAEKPDSLVGGIEIDEKNYVPGTKIRYAVVIRNDSAAMIPTVNLKDIIPQHCHLYYTDLPTIAGIPSSNWEWKGATANSATGEAVYFEIKNMPGNTTVTASYTVTLD